MSRIVNKWRGVCSCGIVVQVGEGYVHQRKITCIQCVPINPPQPLAGQGCEYAYQGYDDSHRGIYGESFGEYLLDIGMTESDYVGFDVGAQ